MAVNRFPLHSLPNENTTTDENWHHTAMNVTKLKYKWTVTIFSFSCNTDDTFECTFSTNANEVKWQLTIYPKGKTKNENYLSTYLKLFSCNKSNGVKARYALSVLNAKNEKFQTLNAGVRQYSIGGDWGFSKYIDRDVLFDKSNNLLPDGKLTLFCEINVLTDNVNVYDQSNVQFNVHPEYTLSEDLGNVFDNLKFCDVTIEVHGQELQAHKFILAARSEVFAGMFEHEMMESELNRVVITDVDFNVMKEMLRFIYTNEAQNLDTMARELLAVADKYALKELKSKCEESLSVELCAETAADTLVFADRYGADKLKAKSIDFITTHLDDVLVTQAFQNMITAHSCLPCQLFRALVTLVPRSALKS